MFGNLKLLREENFSFLAVIRRYWAQFGILCLYLFVAPHGRISAANNCEPVRAVAVVNASNGDVIYSYNADMKIQPASLTKMMTLKLAFDALKAKRLLLSSHLSISKNAARQAPSKLGVPSGGKLCVQDAILALITRSANDIAVALAEYIGGTEHKFVKLMNLEARRLGMKSTFFVNPSGLPNCHQYTTANDMIKLSKALLKEHPRFYRLFATKQFRYKGQSIRNHNRLLGKHENNIVIDGIKTGYVAASGYNLAASATDGSCRLIAVVLGGKTSIARDNHMSFVLRQAFLRAHTLMASKRLSKSRKVSPGYDSSRSALAYIHQIHTQLPYKESQLTTASRTTARKKFTSSKNQKKLRKKK